jgi:hypothetical protein
MLAIRDDPWIRCHEFFFSYIAEFLSNRYSSFYSLTLKVQLTATGRSWILVSWNDEYRKDNVNVNKQKT